MPKEEFFDKDKLIDLLTPRQSDDPLTYINDYTDEMSISQMCRFFEKQGIVLTKAMIQNYVRLGLLPSARGRRYYSREHFMILTLLLKLKDVYPLDILRDLFAPLIEEGPDDNIYAFYDAYLEIYRDSSKAIGDALPGILDKVAEKTDKMNADEQKKQRLSLSLTLLALMVQSSITKQMADTLVEN